MDENKMDEKEALKIISDFYMDAEYYFAENDKYPDNYDEDFYKALAVAMNVLHERNK